MDSQLKTKQGATTGCALASSAGYLNAEKRRKRIEKRFHELAVKSALQKTTPEEENKLDRYQALRRLKRLPNEIAFEARQRFKIESLLKTLRGAIWKSEHSDNENSTHFLGISRQIPNFWV